MPDTQSPNPRAANSLIHGGRAESLLLPDENPADIDALRAEIATDFSFLTDPKVIEDAVHARWTLWRCRTSYHRTESELLKAKPDTALWSDADHKRLALSDRYQTSAERRLRRATVNLEHQRQNHLRALREKENAHRWEIEDNRRERRFKLIEDRAARLATKESAQAELAAARAQAALEKLDREAFVKSYAGNEKPTLKQTVTVSIIKGETHTQFKPSNADVLRSLDLPNRYPYQQVERSFLFANGLPAEYDWAYDPNDRFDSRTTPFNFSETFSVGYFRVLQDFANEIRTPHAVGVSDSSVPADELLGKLRSFFAKSDQQQTDTQRRGGPLR